MASRGRQPSLRWATPDRDEALATARRLVSTTLPWFSAIMPLAPAPKRPPRFSPADYWSLTKDAVACLARPLSISFRFDCGFPPEIVCRRCASGLMSASSRASAREPLTFRPLCNRDDIPRPLSHIAASSRLPVRRHCFIISIDAFEASFIYSADCVRAQDADVMTFQLSAPWSRAPSLSRCRISFHQRPAGFSASLSRMMLRQPSRLRRWRAGFANV